MNWLHPGSLKAVSKKCALVLKSVQKASSVGHIKLTANFSFRLKL